MDILKRKSILFIYQLRTFYIFGTLFEIYYELPFSTCYFSTSPQKTELKSYFL